MIRQERRNKEKRNRKAGFSPVQRTVRNLLKGIIIINRGTEEEPNFIGYKANKKGLPQKRNDGSLKAPIGFYTKEQMEMLKNESN